MEKHTFQLRLVAKLIIIRRLLVTFQCLNRIAFKYTSMINPFQFFRTYLYAAWSKQNNVPVYLRDPRVSACSVFNSATDGGVRSTFGEMRLNIRSSSITSSSKNSIVNGLLPFFCAGGSRTATLLISSSFQRDRAVSISHSRDLAFDEIILHHIYLFKQY